MKRHIRILYLEDSPLDFELVQSALAKASLDFELNQVGTEAAFEAALDGGGHDMILCDYNLPTYDGFSALKRVKEKRLPTPVLIISGTVSEEEIVDCLRMGATDYILKQRLERLAPAVRRVVSEAEAVERTQELEAENKKLGEQLQRVQRLESIGALASGIAHDLNNTLAPVLMGVGLLKKNPAGPQREQMLETMEASVLRGVEMVKQILSFARGALGGSGTIESGGMVTEITKMVKVTFPANILIDTKVAHDLKPTEGNSTQLHQILLNLCVNARDAMPNGGVLRIEAENVRLTNLKVPGRGERVSGKFVMLAVSDTGMGIPPETLNRIFEPFFTTKSPGKGTGLGLSTVQGIVKSSGGFLEVSSEVGKGTVFKVYLPAVEEEPPRQIQDHAPGLPTGGGELVLVVDDDLAILQMLRETLEAFSYRVLTAKNGLEALSQYKSQRKDIAVVITDMMMPFMDGPATIRSLLQVDPHVKIIGVSGLGSESAAGNAENLEVRAYLRKPYQTEVLLSTLRDVLAGKSVVTI